MKKIITLALTLVLVTGLLTACGSTNNNDAPTSTPTTAPTATTAPTTAPDPTDEPTPTEEPTTAPEAPEGGETSGLDATLPEIIESIYAIKDPGLRLGTTEIDLTDEYARKTFTGLDNADKIKEAVVSEAMIGSQAYSMTLVRLNDAADAQEIAEAMKAGINPVKWICVMADDVKVAACDDVVLFIMMDSVFSDMITSADIIEAFRTVCGGTLSVEIN